LAAYFSEVDGANGQNALLDAHIAALKADMADLTDFEPRARDLVDRLATGLQASLLVRYAPAFVAEPFCASRLGSKGAHHYGTLPSSADCVAIISRARPR